MIVNSIAFKKKLANVSVIIPYYNAGATIKRCLLSIYMQTLSVFEVIIVDDCSSENEHLLLKSIIVDFNSNSAWQVSIKLITLRVNKGASYARNIAIKNASAKYLAFLDADDVWLKNKIELQYDFMESNSFFMTGHGYVFDLKKENVADKAFSYRDVNKCEFIYKNPFFTPTIMVLREGLKLFDESFRRVDDYKCWLENFSSGNAAIINIKLAGGFKHPIGASGLTGSLSKMHSAYIDVLKSLYAERVISAPFYYLAKLIELLKYPLRKICSKFL